MNISERLRPKARMRIRICPGEGVGMGICERTREEGPPGVWITAAFMVLVLVDMILAVIVVFGSLFTRVCMVGLIKW